MPSNKAPRASVRVVSKNIPPGRGKDECKPDFVPGYHLRPIAKGQLGELSKIVEEVEELQDAEEQSCKIMQAVELADLYGAIKHYAEKQLGMTMEDIAKMSDVTERAFRNGRRK